MRFKLFPAPYSYASNYRGAGTCSLCSSPATDLFGLDLHADVIVACEGCGTRVALDADDKADGRCTQCDEVVSFPNLGDDPCTCVACLQNERAGMRHRTEIGDVSWQEACQGLTVPPQQDSRPRLQIPGGTMSATPDNAYDSQTMHVEVDAAALKQLVATPQFSTWQDERWLFCCGEPMAFMGDWKNPHFVEAAADKDGEAMFMRVIEEAEHGMWDSGFLDAAGVYVFRCSRCEKHRGYWDIT